MIVHVQYIYTVACFLRVDYCTAFVNLCPAFCTPARSSTCQIVPRQLVLCKAYTLQQWQPQSLIHLQ